MEIAVTSIVLSTIRVKSEMSHIEKFYPAKTREYNNLNANRYPRMAASVPKVLDTHQKRRYGLVFDYKYKDASEAAEDAGL